MANDNAPKRLTPQMICQHNPCYCGRPPHAFQPYDAEAAKRWLADRQAARDSATPTAKP